MLINRIYVDQVALARSFAATFTAQQNVPARLPGRPIRRGPPTGGGRLVRFLRRLRLQSIIDRGNLTIHFKTKYRSRARHLPRHAGRPYLVHACVLYRASLTRRAGHPPP